MDTRHSRLGRTKDDPCAKMDSRYEWSSYHGTSSTDAFSCWQYRAVERMQIWIWSTRSIARSKGSEFQAGMEKETTPQLWRLVAMFHNFTTLTCDTCNFTRLQSSEVNGVTICEQRECLSASFFIIASGNGFHAFSSPSHPAPVSHAAVIAAIFFFVRGTNISFIFPAPLFSMKSRSQRIAQATALFWLFLLSDLCPRSPSMNA